MTYLLHYISLANTSQVINYHFYYSHTNFTWSVYACYRNEIVKHCVMDWPLPVSNSHNGQWLVLSTGYTLIDNWPISGVDRQKDQLYGSFWIRYLLISFSTLTHLLHHVLVYIYISMLDTIWIRTNSCKYWGICSSDRTVMLSSPASSWTTGGRFITKLKSYAIYNTYCSKSTTY